MSYHPVKLTNELLDASLPVSGANADGVIFWTTTPDSGQLAAAAAILAAHDPENYLETEYNLSKATLISKALTRITFLEGKDSVDWDTWSTADQNQFIEWARQESIFFYKQILFLAGYTE